MKRCYAPLSSIVAVLSFASRLKHTAPQPKVAPSKRKSNKILPAAKSKAPSVSSFPRITHNQLTRDELLEKGDDGIELEDDENLAVPGDDLKEVLPPIDELRGDDENGAVDAQFLHAVDAATDDTAGSAPTMHRSAFDDGAEAAKGPDEDEEEEDNDTVMSSSNKKTKQRLKNDGEVDDEANTEADADVDDGNVDDAELTDEQLQSKNLFIRFPSLAKEYDGSNEKPVTDVMIDSGKVVVWSCAKCHHSWKQGVFLRCILKSPCPQCLTKRQPPLVVAHRNLISEWDPTKNDPFVSPEELPISSGLMAHWICSLCKTSFDARVRARVRQTAKCPTCAVTGAQGAIGSRNSSGAEVAEQEWHPVRNGDLKFAGVGPLTKVWWLCGSCGCEWEASVTQRIRGRRGGCPQCREKAAVQK